ncbi:MAG: MvaI/BcnI restriction endonuclease family protein [Bacteroidetes bacterium]|nr:MvaI/BcnI restriction endonuclease family protein [Bacteroidota bacterium]
MTLNNLLKLFSDQNCETVYVKELVKNNNSKQQIYLASGDTQILNVFPVNDFQAVLNPHAKKETFHAACNFSWMDDEGNKFLAPNAKFILYPKYPEVRFSGFVQGCKKAPSAILNNTVPGRYLFFGVSKTDQILGYASDANSEISKEFSNLKNIPMIGILYSLAIKAKKLILDTKSQLLLRLKEIYLKGWINSKQLKPGFLIAPCNESRCGGLTLEAELGIIQNGKSEPDYLGWEIKQFGVKKLHLINSARITLMTPEPDGGFYKDKGGIAFVRKYGYQSLSDRERMDFTGYHKHESFQKKSGLTLRIIGFDFTSKKISDPNGGVFLFDLNENIAASWSFSKMLNHWIKKHAKASYIPSLLNTIPYRQYRYSNNIILGEGTDFSLFVDNIASGKIIYDPGIHIDNISSKAVLKARSQFRISSKHIRELYRHTETVDLDKVEKDVK